MIQLGNNLLDGAACKDLPADEKEWFYAEGRAGTPLIRKAKAICNAGCPVKDSCLQLALDNETPGERFGVFGGLSARERDEQFPLAQRNRDLCGNGLHDMTDPANHIVSANGVRCKPCKTKADARRYKIRNPVPVVAMWGDIAGESLMAV